MDFIWNDLLINPMINGLIIVSRLLFNNFGLAIIAFTILVRAATLPLTLRQLHSSRRMQTLQPKLQEIQKKYKDPKRRSEETMKLYKEEGVNPIGCLGPMVIQMPIWFALYAVLTRTVGGTPERVVELSQRLYPWDFIQHAVPLPTGFLWLDLGRPDTTFILFALVFITTWLQTRLSLTQTAGSAQMQQTNSMMLWLMPIMFAWFSISVPSGLALYWTVTNIVGIVMNYFVYGWRERPWTDLFTSPNAQPGVKGRPRSRPAARTEDEDSGDRGGGARRSRGPAPSGPASAPALTEKTRRTTTAPDAGADERQSDAQSGNKRKERRRGGEQSSPAAGSRPLPGRRRGR